MEAQEFYLVSAIKPDIVIQAGGAYGAPVTLQTKSATNRLQRWVMQAKVAGGFQGIAFVNPYTTPHTSATYKGVSQDLVMQAFHENSANPDSWLLYPSGSGNGNVRITYVKDGRLFWNAWGGGTAPGTRIVTHEGAAPNTEWTIQIARPLGFEDVSEDSALAGEPAVSAV